MSAESETSPEQQQQALQQALQWPEEWVASLMGDHLPSRVKITVAADDAELAAAALDADEEVLRRTEAHVQGQTALFCVEVDHHHRPVAVIRPSLRLADAGVQVLLARPLDVIETVSDIWLQQLIGGPDPNPYSFTSSPTMFAIGGPRIVQQLLDIVTNPAASLQLRRNAAYTCVFALRNTPDEALCQQVLHVALDQLRAALATAPARTRAPEYVANLVNAVEDAVTPVARWFDAQFWPVPPLDQQVLTELLASPCRDLHWPVLKILTVLPGPLSETTAAVVAEVALSHDAKKGASAAIVTSDAVDVLGRCPSTVTVQQALEQLSHSASLEVRLGAMHHLVLRGGPAVARAVWERLLLERSLPARRFATDLIARYGTADDVPAAVGALKLVVKSKHTPARVDGRSGPLLDPPWGLELLDFLWRHREHLDAAAEIQRLRRRWPSTNPELTAWVAEHLPDLMSPAA
ncbi:hypothetical protein [Kineococcus radiotolerans]|uniref:Uncharacterized protein n=1 Tax=Kineococcus radiotolerans (strain ATCC BAA-149 / DSM 14245 / SRS30216) TaxID=266940 RepID=A6WAC6_KINRD|nr:hypothetical protein [Kineococcus radiotolerans]ABS03765.1 hypothetical protein Krad_2284 [Kineococcus radiotolerans SRS30216 = ATCC BAA-149]